MPNDPPTPEPPKPLLLIGIMRDEDGSYRIMQGHMAWSLSKGPVLARILNAGPDEEAFVYITGGAQPPAEG